MYEIKTKNKKVEKRLRYYIDMRRDIIDKLRRLKINPRRECGAHPLHGDLFGKWACWIGSNIRMVYKLDNIDRIILLERIGTHNIY
jgi:addiction module RelE/StbE family toxin